METSPLNTTKVNMKYFIVFLALLIPSAHAASSVNDSGTVAFGHPSLTLDANAVAEASVSSGSTVDLGAQTSQSVLITGTTTISSFGTIGAGIVRRVRFNGTLTLTYNATSLIVPGSANIVTANGDTCLVESLGSGNWILRHYQRANGKALNAPSVLKADTTAVGNVGAGTDTLQTFTIAAAQLANDNESIFFDCSGSFGASANSKTLNGVYGGTTFVTTGSLVFNGIPWRCHGRIFRTGATAQRIVGEITVGGTLLSAVNTTVAFNTTAAETLSGTVVFKFTGSDDGITPADNAVIENASALTWWPAN